MNKILTTKKAIQVTKKLREQNQRVVLAGGCFDILHVGHITFLEKAKQKGDKLFIFVENDASIKKSKGPMRPINTQNDRTKILSHIDVVDYVIPLPESPDYDNLVIALKPAIIATTKGDRNRSHKQRQAQQIGADVIDVTNQISNKSTTRLIKVLDEL